MKYSKEILRVIYGLIDPRDELFHYVGLSINLVARWNNHFSSGDMQTGEWIRELRISGKYPKVDVLGKLISDINDAHLFEERWIAKLLYEGHPLLNIRARINPPVDDMDKARLDALLETCSPRLANVLRVPSPDLTYLRASSSHYASVLSRIGARAMIYQEYCRIKARGHSILPRKEIKR